MKLIRARKDLLLKIVDGIGYFTLNNSEREQLVAKVIMDNIQNIYNFNFVPNNAGSTSTAQFALFADKYEFNEQQNVNITVYALDLQGRINTDYSQSNVQVEFKIKEISAHPDYSVKIDNQPMAAGKVIADLN
ncbi:MAG TPA: hypothetical protein PKX90_12875, partial [bacterium]|nr:hypothetical protein [bacterium]